jgi:CHAT domain-containing protein
MNGLREQAERREKELERLFRADDAIAHRMPLSLAQTANLEQIRAALGPRTTLLEYFQVGPQYVVAVVSRDHLRLETLGSLPEVAASIRMLQFQLSRLRTREAATADIDRLRLQAVQSRLEELYKLLVAPVIRWCHGDHLLVVPHGALHCLPFHALADESSYLIDRFAVSYAPSAGIYSVCQRRKGRSTGPALLMGVGNGRANPMSREIRAVAAVVQNPQVRLGRQATARVLREMGPASRLIHIATHGSFRRDNPLFSSVRLADSYLTVYDLFQMSLPVNLLTLSGCGTGLSVVAAGDELLGLIRGVLLAGAGSFLASLWNVDDRSTAQFMAAFYRNLQNCSDLTVALQRTMTEFRRSHPDPFYWAPFVLVGKSTFGGA